MAIEAMDVALWLVALVVTLYFCLVAENPHKPGSDEYKSLRMCRLGISLALWGIGFGLIGLAFWIAAFVLGIIAIINGRGLYGAGVIAASVMAPIASFVMLVSKL